MKEKNDSWEQVDDLLKKAGAISFEEKYWKLWSLHVECLNEQKKPTKERKFNSRMTATINYRVNDMHEIYADIEKHIQKHNIHKTCSKCGKRHMIHMEDFRKSTHGEPVDFMCSQCRPQRKF